MFETFDHTADLGLRIQGTSFEDMLSEAARALLATLVENPEDVRALEERKLVIREDACELQLFDWLAELLYLFESGGWLCASSEVQTDDDGLEAVIRGEKFDSERHRGAHEVKAITYHGLHLEPTADGGWLAEVIVDI